MEKYEQDIQIFGAYTPGFSFAVLADTLRQAPQELREFIVEEVAENIGFVDPLGNQFEGYDSYAYIELTIDQTYNRFSSIRLLSADQTKRFEHPLPVPTPFTPTVINVLSDLRGLSDRIQEFFGIEGASTALKCGRDSDNLENIVNSVGGVIGAPPANLAGSGVTTKPELTWSEFLERYVLPTPQPTKTSNNSALTREQLDQITAKYDASPIKTRSQVLQEQEEWSQIEFQESIKFFRENSYDVVNSSSDILENPDALSAKVQTLADAFDEVIDKVSLGCLIKSAVECVVPPLTCKEILRGLRVGNIADKIEFAFPNQPRVTALVRQELETAIAENEDDADATDAFLNAIENFIDIEAICDIVSFALSGFEIPTIDFTGLLDGLSIIDLFGSIEIALEDSILDAITNAIIQLILGIIGDLASCDNLDAFIAGALNGEIPADSGLIGDLARIFTNPQDLIDPEKGSIASSLDQRWDMFVEATTPLLEQAITVTATGGASAGESAGILLGIEAAGGLDGIREAIEGNFEDNPIAANFILEKFFQGYISVPDLVRFSGTESADSLNSFLQEIGRFELSSDGNSFTLNRISDDQRVVIFSTIANAETVPMQTSGEELSNSIGKLMDDVVVVLPPTEVLRLFAGRASKKSIKAVKELIKLKHDHLNFISKSDQISSLFKTFGDLTGTGNIEDALILAGNTRRLKNVPKKFCPGDETPFLLQEAILDGKLPREEVKRIIDDNVNKRKDRFNELQDEIIKLKNNDYTPADILENIACGLAPDGSRPAVVQDGLDMTVNTMFEGVKMSYDREVKRYTDAISILKEEKRSIPRKIKVASSGPTGVFKSQNQPQPPEDQEGQTSAFPVSRLSPELTEVYNPEVEKLVMEGYRDSDNDKKSAFEVMDDDSFWNKGPIEIDETNKKIAGNIKEGFGLLKGAKVKQSTSNIFEVEILGSLPPQSPITSYVDFEKIKQEIQDPDVNLEIDPTKEPEWIIRHKEEEQVTTLTVFANGALFSQRYGIIPFADNFTFSQNFNKSLSPGLLQRINELDTRGGGSDSKRDIFAALMTEKVLPALEPPSEPGELRGQRRRKSEEFFTETYEKFVERFIIGSSLKISQNRLLQEVPNSGFGKVFGHSDSSNRQNLVLNLIDFAATPTLEQKKCGADPHLLDLQFIKKTVKDEFDKECEEESKNDGLTPSRTSLNSSGFVGVVLTTIRLHIIEHMLKGLFVFDEYNYTKDFANDELLIHFISSRIKKDLESRGDIVDGVSYYDKFIEELIIAHNKLVESGQFVPPVFAEPPSVPPVEFPELDISAPRDVLDVGVTVNTNLTQLPSTVPNIEINAPPGTLDTAVTVDEELIEAAERSILTNITVEPVKDIPYELKSMVKYQLELVLQKTRDIVGDNPNAAGEDFIKDFLSALPEIDSYSNFDKEQIFATEFTSVHRRLSPFFQNKNSKIRLFLEKYVRIPLSEDPRMKEIQVNNPQLIGVVNFINFKEMLEKYSSEVEVVGETIFRENIGTVRLTDIFESVNYGYRLVAVLDKEEKANIKQLKDRPPEFNFGNDSLELKNFVVEREKSFEVIDLEKESINQDNPFGPTITEEQEYKIYNSVVISSAEKVINTDETNNTVISEKFVTTFLNDIRDNLLNDISKDIDTKVALDYCLFVKRIPSILFLHNSMLTNTEPMKLLFEGTKEELKKLFRSMANMGDYVSKSEQQAIDGVPGNSALFKQDFDSIGSAAGPRGPDALYFALTAPILILRGLAELTDPNIMIASKIIAAAQAGLLAPKEDGSFPGDPLNLPFALVSLALLPMQMFLPILGFSGPPITPLGQLFVLLEPLLSGLPSAASSFEGTSAETDLLASTGVDLSAKKKYKCEDGQEPPEDDEE